MDLSSRLKVVRFRGSVAREYHALAFCIPTESLVRVIYATHEVDCEARQLIKAVDVNVESMMGKAHVLAAVEADYCAVREQVPEYAQARTVEPTCVPHFVPLFAPLTAPLFAAHLQIFADYDAQIAEVRASLALQTLARRPRLNIESCRKTTAKDAIDNFKLTCPEKNMRLTTIASNITNFQGDSQMLMPTSWVKTPPVLEGMQSLDLTNSKTSARVSKLCKQKHLKPPSAFIRTNSFHYGKYENNKLVSVISLSAMNLNKMPGSVAISIDLAASTDARHSMTTALTSIKKMMRKRRNPCVLFTQCAQTKSARAFWAGKLTSTKRASVLTALFHEFDNRYQIYEDAEDMAIFFD